VACQLIQICSYGPQVAGWILQARGQLAPGQQVLIRSWQKELSGINVDLGMIGEAIAVPNRCATTALMDQDLLASEVAELSECKRKWDRHVPKWEEQISTGLDRYSRRLMRQLPRIDQSVMLPAGRKRGAQEK
jgi:hypothetical protein